MNKSMGNAVEFNIHIHTNVNVNVMQCALFSCMFCMADAKMKLLKNT